MTPTSIPTATPMVSETPTAGCDSPLGKIALYPNPSRGLEEIRIRLEFCDAPGDVHLKIFTVSRRLVLDLNLGNIPVGTVDFPMPLKDSHGKSLANGLYYAVLTSRTGQIWTKLVVLR